MKSYLEFERDIKALEEELEKLKDPFNKEGLSEVDTDKISHNSDLSFSVNTEPLAVVTIELINKNMDLIRYPVLLDLLNKLY